MWARSTDPQKGVTALRAVLGEERQGLGEELQFPGG